MQHNTAQYNKTRHTQTTAVCSAGTTQQRKCLHAYSSSAHPLLIHASCACFVHDAGFSSEMHLFAPALYGTVAYELDATALSMTHLLCMAQLHMSWTQQHLV